MFLISEIQAPRPPKHRENPFRSTLHECGAEPYGYGAQGAAVTASDISVAMAEEARRRYEAELAAGASPPSTAPTFEALDLESASGSYNTVTCLDVMIHYPQVT
jgi:hypothetical protein